jgi:hypothetical protein
MGRAADWLEDRSRRHNLNGLMKSLIIFSLTLLVSGCSLDQSLAIDSGSYVIENQGQEIEGTFSVPVVGLQVNRQTGKVTAFLRSGERYQIPYTARDNGDWPSGCPGNIYSQRMEVFDLGEDGPTAKILGLDSPILVRNCPADPYQLVLRQDGELGGASTACPYPETCLYFRPSESPSRSDNPCQDLTIKLEELEREKSAAESWADALARGYGPGVWYFSELERPIFHHSPQSESLESIVTELNSLFSEDSLPTILLKGESDLIVQVGVSDDLQLTQGMGSSGAQAYLQVVLYSLTSLPGIDCVDFDFVEGDHARPGIYCR